MNNSQMMKRKHDKIIIFALIFLLGVTLLLCLQQKHYSANKIYYKTIESIVEVKASSPSKGENYGTAVFVDDSGILVTNAHVVTYQKNGELQGYEELEIRLPTEDDYRDVSLVKYDEELDIAVLQLEKIDFDIKPIRVGDSDKVDYGDKVYSIGNAMNYGLSISEGIISCPDIEVAYDGMSREVIQSDINISSGSSGGALLDEKGRLIGITSFRIKDSSGNIVYGTGFSVPINKVLEYLK